MDRILTCCCGLDIHKRTVVACLLRPGEGGESVRETRTFGTMTDALLALRDWLSAAGCTHVAMESTGVYWKPAYHVLDGLCTVWVVNAAHVKNVPGRKTDAQDAEWLADLLQHGLLRPSIVPDRAQRALRDLTRTRTSLIEQRTAVVNRIQGVLEDANIKLAGVASDIMGVSGRDILAALLEGSADAAAMADLARGKLRRKRAELERALHGRLSDHHRLLVALHLEHADFLDEAIARLTGDIADRRRPAHRRSARRRDRPGREPLPLGRPPGVVGRHVPRQQRERGQEQGRQAAAGQHGAAPRLDRGGQGRRADQEARADLSARPVSPPGGAPRQEESGRSGRSYHPPYRVPCPRD